MLAMADFSTDSVQDGQGAAVPRFSEERTSQNLLTLTSESKSNVGSQQEHNTSPQERVLRLRDPNLQASQSTRSTPDQWSPQSPIFVRQEIFYSVLSNLTGSQHTAQEELSQAHRTATPISSTSTMASSFRPTIDSLLSAPPRRTTPSEPPMLRDQVRNARAISTANTASLRASFEGNGVRHDSRSPSMIAEPQEYNPPDTSRLEPQVLDLPPHRPLLPQSPHAPVKPSKLSSPPQNADDDITTQLEPPDLGPGSYIVALPLPGRIRDQYGATMRYYQRATANLTSGHLDHQTVQEVETLMRRLDNIGNHVDLDDATTAENSMSLEDELQYSVTCSPKFRFLKHLLEQRSLTEKHIVIVACEGVCCESWTDSWKPLGLHIVQVRPE